MNLRICKMPGRANRHFHPARKESGVMPDSLPVRWLNNVEPPDSGGSHHCALEIEGVFEVHAIEYDIFAVSPS